ncbi:MAG: GNAT family N-acetyltransferase [Myxococcota bacterium]
MIELWPATVEDLPIVLDSWCKSMRLRRRTTSAGSFVELGRSRGLAPHIWARALTGVVEGLARESAIAVACHPSHREVVIGWIAFEADTETTTVHYVWVRSEFRRQGVGRMLLEAVRHAGAGDAMRATFISEAGQRLLEGKRADG